MIDQKVCCSSPEPWNKTENKITKTSSFAINGYIPSSYRIRCLSSPDGSKRSTIDYGIFRSFRLFIHLYSKYLTWVLMKQCNAFVILKIGLFFIRIGLFLFVPVILSCFCCHWLILTKRILLDIASPSVDNPIQ